MPKSSMAILDAELAQVLQGVAVPLRRFHQHQLGQLELEISGIDAPARQARLDLALELGGALELHARTR